MSGAGDDSRHGSGDVGADGRRPSEQHTGSGGRGTADSAAAGSRGSSLDETTQAISPLAVKRLRERERGGGDEGRELPVIGPYRLFEVLGRGGMGTVYLAEQEEPIRRRVAIKLIAGEIHSEAVVARFEDERQTLALMQHRAIAQVHDAGSTQSGQPYFVMEYVDGQPLSRYARKRRLSLRRRIELFLEVCEGVGYAHQKGVIHRDLKPHNILVTEEEGRPQPKIIDFGIAEILPRAGDRTPAQRPFLGTPAYMSPQQADPQRRSDVDLRDDVYALGALLYHLLAGRPPYRGEPDTVRALLLAEAPLPVSEARRRREERRTQAGKRPPSGPTARQLAGDLDRIVGKAMARRRSDRYASVGELAADLRCYLEHRPVSAHPLSAAYRLRLFARRHRAAAVTGVLAALALLLGVVAAAAGLIVARQAEERARDEAEIARAVNAFLEDTLSAASPGRLGREVKVAEAVRVAAASLADRFAGRPGVEAGIRSTLGRTFRTLGELDQAEEQLTAAYELADRAATAPESGVRERLRREVARAELAQVWLAQGRLEEAEEGARVLVASLEELASADGRGEDARGSEIALLNGRSLLGQVQLARGDSQGARSLLADTAGRLSELAGAENEGTLRTRLLLAQALYRVGDFPASEEETRQVLAIQQRTVGERHPATLSTLGTLAGILFAQGKVAEVEEVARQLVTAEREILGPEHPHTLDSMNNLGLVLTRLGKLDEAEELARETLAIRRRVLGDEHPRTLDSTGNLADVLIDRGGSQQIAEALRLTEQGLGVAERTLGEDHPTSLTLLFQRVSALAAAGERGTAIELARRGAALRRQTLGPDHPLTARADEVVAGLADSG